MWYGLCSLLKAIEWPIVVKFCVILVCGGELSHWQSYHILFLYLIENYALKNFNTNKLTTLM